MKTHFLLFHFLIYSPKVDYGIFEAVSLKTTGIIAEYNPFHNGHLYHMQQARMLTGADFIVVVMSPDFVQRGEPALLDKWARARMALEAGADLVLEMSVRSAVGSAEYFARGGVCLLDSLGAVDALSFGCETEHTSLLMEFARFLSLEEPADYSALLREMLRKGENFAHARVRAWLELRKDSLCPDASPSPCEQEISGLLRSPNNILAVEYMKAILRRGSRMKLVPVPRKGAGYHDLSSGQPFASASGIRAAIHEGTDVRSQMPPQAFEQMSDELSRGRFLTSADLDLPLRLKLFECRDSLTDYADVNEDLANRIRNLLPQYTGFEQFSSLLKTKQVTHTRIRRALLHILLGLRHSEDRPAFARILGFRTRALPLLRQIREQSSVPLLSKLPPDGPLTASQIPESLREDLRAAELWELLVSQKNGAPARCERQRRIIRL